MARLKQVLVFFILAVLVSPAYADQGSFTNSGGSTSASAGVSISSDLASPVGSLTINCPATGPKACAGFSTFQNEIASFIWREYQYH